MADFGGVPHDGKNIDLAAEVAELIERGERLRVERITAENAPLFAQLIQDEISLRKRLNAAKSEEKRPHDEANAEIEVRFKGWLTPIADAAKVIKSLLDAFRVAEESRRRAAAEAARQAAEEERRKAEEARQKIEAERRAAAEAKRKAEAEAAAAAKPPPNPFAAFDQKQAEIEAEGARLREEQAVQARADAAARAAKEAEKAAAAPVRIAGAESGRAVAAKKTPTYTVTVTDPEALIMSFARMKHTHIAEECRKLAQLMVKAGKGVNPGIDGIAIKTED